MSDLASNLTDGGIGLLYGLATYLLIPLVLTLAIEVPVAAAMGLRTRREIWAVVLVNLVTNPLLNLFVLTAAYFSGWGVLFGGGSVSSSVVVGVLEVSVVIAEWRLLLWAVGGSSRKMLLTSIAMNAASFLFGLAAYWALFNWIGF